MPSRCTPTSSPRSPAGDDHPRPPSWRLSPRAVVTYLLGGELPDGTVITPKYVGPRRLIEVAVATLATDRALLLLGVPGTAKTWVSEHLAAAVSGDSTLLVQGTSGTAEEAIRYGWNYARLLAEGPSRAALVPSPVLTAMAEGRIARVEELTRIPSDVQDALITILSEKSLPVPELGIEVQAVKGFSVIATANDRDRGVNDLSSALRRRFNTVVLPLPASEDEEVDIVTRRVAQLGQSLELPPVPSAAEEIRRVVTVFRELRSGVTADQRTRLKSPTGTLSPAEAISVVTSGIVLGGALRRRGAARGRHRRGDHRRDRQGPGSGRGRLDRVPGSRRRASGPAGRTSTAPAARSRRDPSPASRRARPCPRTEEGGSDEGADERRGRRQGVRAPGGERR